MKNNLEMTNYQMVEEFHEIYDCLVNETPTLLKSHEWDLREHLIQEEFDELRKAYAEKDIVNFAKELADLLYVCYGTAVAAGINIDKVFEEVHASNMSKLGANGKVLRREDGKVLKGPKYRPPNLNFIMENNDASST